MKNYSKHLPIIAFIALGVIWGSNFIYMKLASNLISPIQVVFFRVLFGFIPVFVYALYLRVLRWQHLQYIKHYFVMSLLATAIYYYGFVKGSSLLLSGVAGAMSGSIPLFSFLLAVIFLAEEKITKFNVGGIVIGFLGVVIIARPSGQDIAGTNLEGVLYMIAGSLSVGASFVYAKKYVIPLKIPVVALTTYQLGLALLILAVVTDYTKIEHIWTNYNASLGLIFGLGLLGTGLAYIIYYFIVENLGAIVASSVTYIPPVVALLIGVILINEPIELSDYFATMLIFAGVFLLRKKSETKIE